MNQDTMTTAEVTKCLNITREWVRQLVSRDILVPCCIIKQTYRPVWVFKRSEIEYYKYNKEKVLDRVRYCTKLHRYINKPLLDMQLLAEFLSVHMSVVMSACNRLSIKYTKKRNNAVNYVINTPGTYKKISEYVRNMEQIKNNVS